MFRLNKSNTIMFNLQIVMTRIFFKGSSHLCEFLQRRLAKMEKTVIFKLRFLDENFENVL